MFARTLLILTTLMLAACASLAPEDDEMAGEPPLIDRELFFGDPEISGGQLSPDGEWVTFVQPLDGVPNVWIKDVDADFDTARPLTDDRDRPVRSYYWSRDSRYVLFLQDDGGDEDFRLYRVDPGAEPEEGERVPPATDLTPDGNVQVRVVARPFDRPDETLVAFNDRDPALHDVYRMSIATGEKEKVFRNDAGVASFTADLDGRLRLGTIQRPDGGWAVHRIDDDGLDEDPVSTCSVDETCSPLQFHPDGQRVYFVTNAGERDLSELVLLDVATGETEPVHRDPEERVDFGGAQFSPGTGRLLATHYTDDRRRVYPQDEGFARDYERIEEALGDRGDIGFGAVTADERQRLVSLTSDTDPGAAYIYDRGTGQVEHLYRPRPDLPVEYLAPMEPIRYEARDGLEIPAYLTRPRGAGEGDLPVVVLPHGGPWTRDTWGYDAQAQFLANRGYAVLQPNFRGSSGYGKAFLAAGNEGWGTGPMQHDITDGVDYLVEQGIAGPERVGIMGTSYGGYATLAGLAFTPDLYAAGVSIVGPSSIITLLESIPPYWGPVKQIFTERVGDPDDPEDRERLKAQSPLYSAESIRAPLLVVQGANDPRVVQRESDQIVAALRDLDRTVEYLVAADEGHGMARSSNRLAMFAEIERFLASHLGGRYQEDMPETIRETLEALRVDIDTVDPARD